MIQRWARFACLEHALPQHSTERPSVDPRQQESEQVS
jgi:hypothetical protein